jgi:hypothetical protein
MANIKDNLTAIIAPGASNDETQGYGPGSEWFDIATGSFHKCLDATAGAASWMEVAPEYPGWAVGNYRLPPNIAQMSDSATITANLLTLQPIVISRRVQIDRIALRLVTAQTGAAARLGLYGTDPETNHPGKLVVDGGELSLADTTGDRWRTVSVSLKPGLYWTACLMKSVTTMPTVRRVGGSIYGHLSQPNLDEVGSSAAYRYLEASQTYGALPEDAPAATPSGSSHGPVIALRRAA